MISTLKFGGILRFIEIKKVTFGRRYICGTFTSFINNQQSVVMTGNRRLAENAGNKFQIYHVTMRNLSAGVDQTSVNESFTVRHDPEGERFHIEIPGIGTANIEYQRRDQLMILKHTEVPPELGGRGLGKILAKEALDYVAKNDLQLEIQCSFIRNYVSKYEPKYIKYIKK